jgi:hypothetical protein
MANMFKNNGTAHLHVIQNKLIEGSSKKVTGALYENKNNVILRIF